MSERAVQRINIASFITSLFTILLGVIISVLGVWEAMSKEMMWRMLATDVIVFAGAVLTNLAIACYKRPGISP